MVRLAVTAAALAALAVAAPAIAQDIPQVPSPLKVNADPNGVNIHTGKVTMPMPVLSVPAAPNLRFDRFLNAAPMAKGRVFKNSPDSTASSSFSVHTGKGISEAFQCVEIDCGSANGTGSTFRFGMARNAPIIYREAGSGAVYNFNLVHVDTYGSTDRSIVRYVSSIAYPNGETLSYTYDGGYLADDPFGRTFYRTNRITSNLGYYITLAYAPGVVGEPGWSTVTEAALYAAADPAAPVARFTYSGNTATDLGGRVFTCDCTTADQQQESVAGAVILPGEAAPTYQVAKHPGADVVASVVKDGVPWTYSYTNLRYDGHFSRYVWDVLTIDGPNGLRTIYGRGTRAQDFALTVTDSIGRVTAISYDGADRPTKIVYPEGNSVEIGYDEWGNIVYRKIVPKPNSGLAQTNESVLYPADTCTGVACYRPIWARDSLGRQTDFVHGPDGQLTEQTDPADSNGVRRKTYIAYAAPNSGPYRKSVVRVCGEGPAGSAQATCGTSNELRTEYDYFGATYLPSAERRIDSARGVTLTTAYSYDLAGRPLVVDGPLPGPDDAAYFRYDIVGRKTWEIGAKGSNGLRPAKRFTYRDSDDKAVAVEEGILPDPLSGALTVLTRSDVAYDSHRNPIRETLSAGGAVQSVVDRSWDDRGRPVCEARRMNPASFGESPGACALTTPGAQGPDRITRNVYDAASQLLQVQRAYGTPLQQNYATYQYTLNGRQRAVIDANGNRAEMSWDGFDRQKRWTFPSATAAGLANPADYEEYGYDVLGNRVSLRKRDGVVLTYAYDGANRLVQKSVPASASGAAGYSVFYGYDVAGLQLYARFGSASGPGVTNAYDGFGRLVSSTTTMDGVPRTLTSTYDSASNRIGLNGDSGYGTAFDFDPAGRMTAYREGGAASAIRIGYDAAGRRSSLGSGMGTSTSSVAYGYDSLGRLQSLTHDLAGTASDQALTFAYNPASQIVTRTSSNDAYAADRPATVARTYGVNGLNQYTGTVTDGAPAASFQYDLNGNLTSDGLTTFVYDAENRLVSASGARNAALAYDPFGRLWQISSAATGTTRFLYDGDRLVMEFNGAGTLLRSYVHGPGPDEPLVWYELVGGPVRRFYHADHQGSVIAVADEAGSPIAINAYDPWGVPNAANLGRFGYTGQAWLPELGMYYYKARIYSPRLGRFLQTDPIGYEDQVNLYAYVGNDPLNKEDPTGLDGACFYGPSQCNNISPSNILPNLRVVGDFITDFIPFIGDAKAGYAAYENPNAVNIIVAAIGIVPGAGDLAGKVIRGLERGARTLEKRALQHEAKAAREASNPTIRPGM